MSHDVVTYLEASATRLRARAGHRYALPAVTRLRSSAAYQARDWARLGELAQDLIDENRGTLRVAHKYPDLFHPNVARSRQAENRVYRQVTGLLKAA